MRHCLGCGFCCLKSPCVLGQMRYGSEPTTRCPGLVWKETRYICQIIEDRPEDDSLRIELAVGEGCCCGLNTWRRNVKFRG
jgi:hypothetical protein